MLNPIAALEHAATLSGKPCLVGLTQNAGSPRVAHARTCSSVITAKRLCVINTRNARAGRAGPQLLLGSVPLASMSYAKGKHGRNGDDAYRLLTEHPPARTSG